MHCPRTALRSTASGVGLRVLVSRAEQRELLISLYLSATGKRPTEASLILKSLRVLCDSRHPSHYRRRCLQPVVCMISDDVDDGRLRTYCPVLAIDDVSKSGLSGLVIHATGDLLRVGIAQGIMIRSEASRGLQSSRTITTSLDSWDAR